MIKRSPLESFEILAGFLFVIALFLPAFEYTGTNLMGVGFTETVHGYEAVEMSALSSVGLVYIRFNSLAAFVFIYFFSFTLLNLFLVLSFLKIKFHRIVAIRFSPTKLFFAILVWTVPMVAIPWSGGSQFVFGPPISPRIGFYFWASAALLLGLQGVVPLILMKRNGVVADNERNQLS